MAPKKNRQKKKSTVPDRSEPSSPASSSPQHPDPGTSSSLPAPLNADLISIRFRLLYSEIFRDIALSELPSDAKVRQLPQHTGVIDLCRLLLQHHGVNLNQHFGVQFLPQVGENIAASSWSKMDGASIMLHPITEAQVPLYKQAQHLQYMSIPTPGLVDGPLYKQALHLQSMSVEQQVDSWLKVVDGGASDEHKAIRENNVDVEHFLTKQVQELETLHTVTKRENEERMEELVKDLEELRSVVEELQGRVREREVSRMELSHALGKAQDIVLNSSLFINDELDGSWTTVRGSGKPSRVARCQSCARPL